MDSMRDVLARTPGNRTCATACATPRSPLRRRGDWLVDLRGASAGFSHRERLLFAQRALSVSGAALTGLGFRSRKHVSRARDERRLLGTPRVAGCTASGGRTACHPSVHPNAPQRRWRYETLQAGLKSPDATLEEREVRPRRRSRG